MRPSAEEGQEEFKKIEIALTWGEELIRRKRDYGTELGEWTRMFWLIMEWLFDEAENFFKEENAADLCIKTISLTDKYDIDNFDERRQYILTALVACCPVISAP